MFKLANYAAAAFPAYLLFNEVRDVEEDGVSIYRCFLLAVAVAAPMLTARQGGTAQLTGLGLSVGIVLALTKLS